MAKKINVLFTEDQIKARVAELGKQISKDYADKKLHVIGILKGSFIVLADLVREIENDLTVDFMTLSSYGNNFHSSNTVTLKSDLTCPVEGMNVLIVEDIVDTGLTLQYLIDNISKLNPKSLKVCSLLHKPELQKVDVNIDYLGFTIPNKFVIGYGLDAAMKYRNLPYIGVLDGGEEE